LQYSPKRESTWTRSARVMSVVPSRAGAQAVSADAIIRIKIETFPIEQPGSECVTAPRLLLVAIE
jgi:hypothetical protein